MKDMDDKDLKMAWKLKTLKKQETTMQEVLNKKSFDPFELDALMNYE